MVPRKLNISRPVGVSVSTASVSERSFTPALCSLWAVSSISRKRAAEPVHLPDHQLVLGPEEGERRLEGRALGAGAPDSFSSKILPQPARVSASRCRSRFWSSVETRA